eukprot:jgi/Botrbrau1/11824/Bobra.0224s0021.1
MLDAYRSLGVGCLWAGFLLLAFMGLLHQMPPMAAEEWSVLKSFPTTSVPQLILVRDVILNYAAERPGIIMGLYSLLYILMMTLGCPGTLGLSLLAGALYGVRGGLLLVACVSSLGACSCYVMSSLIGKALVKMVLAERLESYAAQVSAQRTNLLFYIVLLRVTPVLPNTFINVASPIVDVPLGVFFLGTLLGCLPNNFLAVKAGTKLAEIKTFRDMFDMQVVAIGCMVVGVAIGSLFLKRRYERLIRRAD